MTVENRELLSLGRRHDGRRRGNAPSFHLEHRAPAGADLDQRAVGVRILPRDSTYGLCPDYGQPFRKSGKVRLAEDTANDTGSDSTASSAQE